MGGTDSRTLLERVEARTEWQGECLVYTGPRDRHGYGKCSRGTLAHRVAYIERHGPLPADKPVLMHTCDNPPCIRDEHLVPGTQAENLADMSAKQRRGSKVCSRGHGKEIGRACKACDAMRHRAMNARRKTAMSA